MEAFCPLILNGDTNGTFELPIIRALERGDQCRVSRSNILQCPGSTSKSQCVDSLYKGPFINHEFHVTEYPVKLCINFECWVSNIFCPKCWVSDVLIDGWVLRYDPNKFYGLRCLVKSRFWCLLPIVAFSIFILQYQGHGSGSSIGLKMEARDCPPLNINAMRVISVKSYLNLALGCDY